MKAEVGRRWEKLRTGMMQKIVRADKPYLVFTGCGRSGTKYISHVMQAAGLDVGHHDKLGNDGISSWICAPWKALEGCVILHQVRDPLKQIASMTTANADSWDYISEHIEADMTNKMRRCMQYWYHWNMIVLMKSHISYRVENIENRWQEICRLCGIDSEFPDISKTINTRSGSFEPLEMADLERCDLWLMKQIVSLGKQFGYEY